MQSPVQFRRVMFVDLLQRRITKGTHIIEDYCKAPNVHGRNHLFDKQAFGGSEAETVT